LPGFLPGGEHRLGHALAQGSMVINASETQISKGEPAQSSHGIVCVHLAALESFE
jgi:hypothetical protein